MAADMHNFDAARLRTAVRLVVAGFGSSERETDDVTDNLIEANLTGHDSHGIGLLRMYADSYLAGGLQRNQQVKTVLDAGALLRLDGQQGFGQSIGRQAMEIGIARAKQLGCCVMALGNSHHLGRIGAWAEMAVAQGLVSLHFVNVLARPIVAPYGGSDGRFGTNPFTAGIPLAGREPFILDFATSVIAQGKTRVAHNKGVPVPPDHLIDNQGRPTTDPRYSVVEPWGAILAFGAHKGYGLAAMCELLGGALAAGMTLHEPGARSNVLNGMLTVLIDPVALTGSDAASYEQEALRFVDWVRASPPREGFEAVRIAGEPERETKAQRLRDGVPVDTTTWQQILEAGDKLGVNRASVQAAVGAG